MLFTSTLKNNLPGGACPRTPLEEVRTPLDVRSTPKIKQVKIAYMLF